MKYLLVPIYLLTFMVGRDFMPVHPAAKQADTRDPIRIEGPEQSAVNPALPDGGLLPVFGVQNFQVFRACRTQTNLGDSRGWTYNHHMDMACWKGRLYIAWESGEMHEDIWPAHEIYSTSQDGVHWEAPQELFPQGIGTPLRMYFFHAPNGRMLALAGLRFDHEKTTERRKGPLVVREITSKHTLGTVYTLRPLPSPSNDHYPPRFSTSPDHAFVQACEQLLADHTFLEQQDYGNLLDDHGMPWHDPTKWPSGKFDSFLVENFGKAMSFYHRRNGELVGIGKRGWVTVSRDNGKTWSQPVIPQSLVTGTAKVWGQRTSDGRYVLVYNPDKKEYFPLVAVQGDDGESFRDMRVVHGEASPMRYSGNAKEFGPRYIRGISEWANDGSRNDKDLWVVYSLNEEDVWVSRIPVPVRPMAIEWVKDDFAHAPAGPFVPNWNTYSPQWAPVTLEKLPDTIENVLQLEDRDPYDYARATRLFPESETIHVSFMVQKEMVMNGPLVNGSLEIEIDGGSSDLRPIRAALALDGHINIWKGNAWESIGFYNSNRWLTIDCVADAQQQHFTLSLNGKPLAANVPFAQPLHALKRLSFRTGEYRPRNDKTPPVPPERDHPLIPVRFQIRDVRISP